MDRLFSLNTATMAMSGSAVVVGTMLRHFVNKKQLERDEPPRSELLYDEAFSVMRAFFEKASLHTCEDLQKFGNNWVPAPFWVRIVRVTIPLPTRLEAGQVLIDTLGEDEIQNVVGGREWWQRTAQKKAGITGEWISMKKDWEGLADGDDDPKVDAQRAAALKKMKEEADKAKRKQRKEGQEEEERNRKKAETNGNGEESAQATEEEDADEDTTEEEPQVVEDEYSEDLDEMRCLLYIHGGGYFFGSINTHRYSIWRYARKMGGRAFAIEYRLAPQYPFPCALADALASYIYLIRPPPGAKHKPVDPAKITIAGDSAGGGLTLALLCLIRDSGLPAPAGAVLISPWCDLTHSFPSILENTGTDIIPAYGWLFKPSTLWPPPPAEFQARANSATSIDSLRKASEEKKQKKGLFGNRHASEKGKELAKEGDPHHAEKSGGEHKEATAEVAHVLKVKVDGKEVEVHEQIQLYATNEQLAYPFVSPIWQPSLGGLPPLYIMCGDKEVLRDEIVYMAHRAANPSAYPLRKALLEANPERTRKAKEYPPTKVHLQIYDGVCHDLPLMSFTTPAKYCYRAIASFIKYVTTPAEDHPPPSPVPRDGMSLPVEKNPTHPDAPSFSESSSASVANGHANGDGTATPQGSDYLSVPPSPAASSIRKRSPRPSASKEQLAKPIPNLEKTIYSSSQPFNRPDYVDNMIRERVGISGVVRPMEDAKDMPMLHLDPEEIGLVKEGPVKRYLAGQALWDKRFKKTYEQVQKRREHHLKKSISEETSRIKKRLKELRRKQDSPAPRHGQFLDAPETGSPEAIDGVEGIWNLHGERPPPSSIAARKDTMEARKLATFLNEHYARIHALHLWSDVQEASTPAGPPRKSSTENLTA